MNRLPECRYVNLFFMGDLNLFGKDYNQIDSLVQTVQTHYSKMAKTLLFFYIYVN